METLNATAAETLALLEKKGLLRCIVETEPLGASRVRRAGAELISFSSNDYLGLSRHPRVLEVAGDALMRYGAGAGASRLAGGSHALYAALEEQLARMKGTEAALVFGSGYLANLGTIPALVGAQDLILADKRVHACMLDAARLSGATLMRFAPNNVEHCAALLADHRGEYARCLVLTETVFSMDGDLAPVAALSKLAHAHDAWLMVDDAHGLGVVENCSGADIIMGTLSKAAGAYGGYVCASAQVIRLLQNNARSMLFSTALPPAVVAAAHVALEMMQDAALGEMPRSRARMFTELAGLEAAESAIVPLILGEPERAVEAARALEEQGFYVAAIRPPTVPPGTSRLRFAFSALHTEDDVRAVVAALTRGGYL